MRRLIDQHKMLVPLQAFAAEGKLLLGTCAGLILLASRLVDYNFMHIGILDAKLERNSFGRQVNSFDTKLSIKDVVEFYPAVFIRAPHIVEVGPNVEILAYP